MNWIKRKWMIAMHNKLLWWNLLLIFCTWVVVFGYPAPSGADLRLRMWAMFLQLVGVITVWWDLTDAAKAFKRDGVLKRTVAWLRALFGVPVTAVIQLSGPLGNVSASASSGGRIQSPLGEGMEGRVAALEANVVSLKADVTGAYAHANAKASELQEKITQESQARTHEHATLRRSLEDLAVGNYTNLLFGVVWLGAGVCLSSLAPEIVKIVAGEGAEVLKMLTATK